MAHESVAIYPAALGSCPWFPSAGLSLVSLLILGITASAGGDADGNPARSMHGFIMGPSSPAHSHLPREHSQQWQCTAFSHTLRCFPLLAMKSQMDSSRRLLWYPPAHLSSCILDPIPEASSLRKNPKVHHNKVFSIRPHLINQHSFISCDGADPIHTSKDSGRCYCANCLMGRLFCLHASKPTTL